MLYGSFPVSPIFSMAVILSIKIKSFVKKGLNSVTSTLAKLAAFASPSSMDLRVGKTPQPVADRVFQVSTAAPGVVAAAH
jgi:hypothetical protein